MGYYQLMAAMPSGEKRCANLDILLQQSLEFAKNGHQGIYRFTRYIESLKKSNVDFGEASVNGENTNAVRIMTIHKSKGLEFNSVYFVGLEDSAFWNFKKQPMEDRCAFFVALSRAKQSVTFTYCNYRHGLKYPKQSKNNINEFYSLLQQPGIANIYRIDE